MEKHIFQQFVEDAILFSKDIVQTHIMVPSNFVQLAAILGVFMVARFVAPKVEHLYVAWCERRGRVITPGTIGRVVFKLIFPAVWLVHLWLLVMISRAVDLPDHIMTIAMSLLAAWLVIRPAGILFKNPMLSKSIAFSAWLIAALNILNLLDKTLLILSKITFTMGKHPLSLLGILKGILLFSLLTWITSLATSFIERKMTANQFLSPSIKVLSTKLIKIALVMTAVLLSLSAVGIDLTAFAVFGGAVGVGVGLGLQKSVANFTSGIMLLLDKSIKPGDVIAVGNTYGWVKSLNARYVSIETRSGIEHLIPNEDLIVQRVENWTFSNNRVRLNVPVGVHYKSDVKLAMALCVQAVTEAPRVLDEPKPICLMTGFGESSVDLDVRFWIDDPENGISPAKSAVLVRIWDLFHEHGIEIPYPQRDIYIKTPLTVTGAGSFGECDASGVASATEGVFHAS